MPSVQIPRGARMDPCTSSQSVCPARPSKLTSPRFQSLNWVSTYLGAGLVKGVQNWAPRCGHLTEGIVVRWPGFLGDTASRIFPSWIRDSHNSTTTSRTLPVNSGVSVDAKHKMALLAT